MCARMAAAAPHPATRTEGTGALFWFEYGLRLVFFAVGPIALVIAAQLVPMWAAIVNVSLALVAFFFGEVLRRHAEQRGWLGRLLARQFAFEAYYREHPPRSFVYYLFYPLLFPYWLVAREARREFWLFKGYTLGTAAIAVVSGAIRYATVYQPVLPFKSFLAVFGIGLAFEAVLVLALLVPMTTTVVALHRTNRHGALVALLVVGLLSASAGVYGLAKRHRSFPSLEARWRVGHRSAARPKEANKAMYDALVAAWAHRRKGEGERYEEGLLDGPPVDAAREKLQTFYPKDEAAAFELWSTSARDKDPMLVLYAEGPRKGRPEVLAMRKNGTVVTKMSEIPRAARKMFFTVGQLNLQP